ncbi:hypothetical protein NBRC116494_06720 [Aurantivibrio plasticivorans]
MSKHFILALPFVLAAHAQAIEIIEPQVHEFKSVSITSSDDQVATLGQVSFIVDFSAARDNLFELEIRREELKLKDGRNSEVFAYDKDAGVIIAASAPVSHISISGKNGSDVLALFHNAKNEVIAPRPNDIRLFDLNFQPLDFSYTPALTPSSMRMNVTILIDRSGSMAEAMPSVLTATRGFMANLPDFTRCRIFTFGADVQSLTPHDPAQLSACPQSLWVLNRPIHVGGGTALFSAIHQGLAIKDTPKSTLPNLVIVLTDGINTQGSPYTLFDLADLKKQSNSKIMTFWAGAHNPAYLKGLADIESVSTRNVKTDLDIFFHTIGVSVSGMQTLHLTSKQP